MNDKREQLLSLFERLTPDQQDDIIQIMKTWIEMPSPAKHAPAGENPVTALAQHPELSNEWHCLNALKKVVEEHYPPRVELGYIAFHPDLDSISTAKTRDAARKMYILEAAYELKAIFEQDPDSELLDKDIMQTLQRYLHGDHAE
ncbi:hypothetical protein [Effusibacillus pohliae]|uniref:hypothetical protein n=1 Tax=Effusibacillus pohliae TaxID=232270 RepID=UPI000360C83B|nr:hypothetical protein [Effusibacillus pohliae]